MAGLLRNRGHIWQWVLLLWRRVELRLRLLTLRMHGLDWILRLIRMRLSLTRRVLASRVRFLKHLLLGRCALVLHWFACMTGLRCHLTFISEIRLLRMDGCSYSAHGHASLFHFHRRTMCASKYCARASPSRFNDPKDISSYENGKEDPFARSNSWMKWKLGSLYVRHNGIKSLLCRYRSSPP